MILIQPDRLARTCACPDDRREFLEFPLVWLRRWIYRFQAVQLKQIFQMRLFHIGRLKYSFCWKHPQYTVVKEYLLIFLSGISSLSVL